MAERLRGVVLPTWALGLLVALLTFPVAFGGPGGGLDSSWGAGLYMAVHDGLSFGPDIVYTYGPLGFLFAPVLWFDGLAVISFLYGTAIWIGLAIALVWSLRRNLGAIAAVIVAFAVLALFPSLEITLAIAVLWAFAVLHPERPRWALEGLIVGGALFAAVEILVKLSVGPVILAVMLLALFGARARLWQFGLFAGVFAVGVVVLWLATGGALGDLADYVTNGREIISGYSEALAVPVGVGWQRFGVAASVVLLAAAAAFASPRVDGRARWCGVGIALIAGFAIYKEGVVRSDEGHMTVAMATMVALWLAVPLRNHRIVLIGGLIAIAALALKVQPGVDTGRLNAIENVGDAEEQAEILFSGTKREQIRDYGRLLMRDAYGVDDAALAELQGRTVSVDPWEISAAWAYDLDWYPVPIFQNYQAYTEKLDELNAGTIADPDGPERILRQNPAPPGTVGAARGVDNHYGAWDPPAQAIATLCNFKPLHTTERWQVLGRVPDRCGEPELVESVDSAFGETVDVPQPAPGEVVFARIDGAEVSGLEKLRTLLFRSRFRYAVVNGEISYRLVPGTAGDGLLMAGSPKLVGEGPWADAPGAETIELTGIDGDLRYDFYAMSVRPSEAQRHPRGRED